MVSVSVMLWLNAEEPEPTVPVTALLLSVTVNVPVRAPFVVGAKATLMVQGGKGGGKGVRRWTRSGTFLTCMMTFYRIVPEETNVLDPFPPKKMPRTFSPLCA
jgi:hypothetical protein